MSYNFINEASSITPSKLCKYDSVCGYRSNFSEDGDVGGWSYYAGVHTYGCWNGFLFGTLWRTAGLIGRGSTFVPVPADTHYTVRIVMKIEPSATGVYPTTGRIAWRTLADPSWSSSKQLDFDLEQDNDWHVYVLNMGHEQWWQGDVNDLRIYPAYDATDGDQFFIRSIQIVSTSTYRCSNGDCSYYLNYEHNCPGAGTPGTCQSNSQVKTYTIIEGVNDELIVNINGYGSERIKIPAVSNESGARVASLLTYALSRVDIGGYVEALVEYDDVGYFKISSGTYTNESSVVVEYSPAAVELGFFSASATDLSTKTVGSDPATGFVPQSSIRLKSFQISEILDGDDKTYVDLSPFAYGVEGGRNDFLQAGLGAPRTEVDSGNRYVREYSMVENTGKTVVDFSHPFNNSGRVTKIYIGGSFSSDCKVKIFRPRRGGTYDFIRELTISYSAPALASNTQEYITTDCDFQVHKGDVIGIYNADLYVGTTRYGIPDAQYLQINGDHSGSIDASILEGEGTSGFIVYARGDYRQEKLMLDIDLGHRYNIESISFEGEVFSEDLEFNIARCLDINWTIDTLGHQHTCGYFDIASSTWKSFDYDNEAYGISNLSDGVYVATGGAGTGYSASDSGGMVVYGAEYFFLNGDQEWLSEILFSNSWHTDDYVEGFDNDPFVLYLNFPRNTWKYVKRSTIYFKEYNNFRDFDLAYFSDPLGINGTAEDKYYSYIPAYTKVTLNNVSYYEGMELYETVEPYLFANPCSAQSDIQVVGTDAGRVQNYEQYLVAASLDWSTLSHEWEPVLARGFRIRCDYHKSTKINEIEVFCSMDDVGSNLSGSARVAHSFYGDFWTESSISEVVSGEEAEALVGDTPRYITVEVEPINTIRLKNIKFNLGAGDLFVGDKGCEYSTYADHSRVGRVNSAQAVTFKNTYGRAYDLYVDIAKDSAVSDGMVFNSGMNDGGSVNNPDVGADAYYVKYGDYPLRGQNNNCAINCPCYGLNGLMNGAEVYYRFDEDSAWQSMGTYVSGTNLNFSNVPTGSGFTNIAFKLDKQYNIWFMRNYGSSSNLIDLDELEYIPASVSTTVTENDTATLCVPEGKTIIDYESKFGKSGTYVDCGTCSIGSQCCSVTYSVPNCGDPVWGVLKEGILTLWYDSDDPAVEIVYSATNTDDINFAVFDSDATDAKWINIRMLNGDGYTRTVGKIEAYPALTSYIAPGGGYNSSWTSLGNSITAYSTGENVALNATASGSSQFGDMLLSRITDGYIGDDLSSAWGSDDEETQWVEVDLGEVKSIYRVKIYHGYDDTTTYFMNKDYTIQISTDASSYTTIFTINNNTDLERTHDLSEPVNARWVKINITDYDTQQTVQRDSEGSLIFFEGAVLREVEIYEYYGYQVISSEEWPVIAINLQDQFYLVGLDSGDLIGVDEESTSTNWTSAGDDFMYSDSVFSDPKKVSFLPASSADPLYEQWVVVRQNTAEGLGAGPDYLKHVVVSSMYETNPFEQAYWWTSNLSTLSNDVSKVVDTVRSLKIEYPTSSGTEIVKLTEGDSFGTDSFASWRDGLRLNLYVEDVDKLDTDFGYFYFGNQDDDREYRWNLSTLYGGGALSTGWNSLFLRFKSVDEFVYEYPVDPEADEPGVISETELKSFGFVFRGRGESFSMNLDGMKIERNHFKDYTAFDYGLYLHATEHFGAPISQVNFSQFSLEFFIRPDFGPYGTDSFYQIAQRNLFSFISNANDMVGAYVFSDDVGVYFGNLRTTPQVYLASVNGFWEIDDTLHFAFVFSNDGTGMDNGDTIRFYLNNQIVGSTNTTWDVVDPSLFRFTLGGDSPYSIRATRSNIYSSSVDSVVSNLKMHNYCKTDYTDSLAGQSLSPEELVKPSEMIEISKDNLTFYNVDSGELPLVYSDVADGAVATVYVRTSIPRGLTGKEKRTAALVASWDIGV